MKNWECLLRMVVVALGVLTIVLIAQARETKQGYSLVFSSLDGPSGQATPLDAAPLIDPVSPNPGSDNVGLDTATFTSQTVAGADEYQIQVSKSRSFGLISASPVAKLSSPAGTTQTYQFPEGQIERQLSLDLTEPQTLFWRVGARNSTDALRPLGGFVFSAVASFTTAEEPPPPPRHSRSSTGSIGRWTTKATVVPATTVTA
jgi:hypothetical protein